MTEAKNEQLGVAVFGGGCFWCTEAVFDQLRGLVSVESGYAGGTVENPTYGQVSSGMTGHAEVIRIEFDPSQISYSELLTVFFATHDPTTLDQQGNDVGPQYRSIILYTTPAQKEEADQFIQELNGSDAVGEPIVTEVVPLSKFYPAEAEHQEFYKNNSESRYCQLVINPKLDKVKKEFAKLLASRDA